MTRTRHILAALLFATAGTAFGQHRHNAPSSYTVEGRVTDFVTHNGIAEVTIETVDDRKHTYSTLTGKDGSYKLEHLPRKPKLTMRCRQMDYSPNPMEKEIDFENGTATWNVHLFLASAGKDYLNGAADALSSMSGIHRLAEAEFVAKNVGPEGQKIVAQELRKRLNDSPRDFDTVMLATLFHFDQLPIESQPGSASSPAVEAEAASPPAYHPDHPANAASTSEPSTPLDQTLQSIYVPTKTTADRSDIVTAGSILTLNKDNLLMSEVGDPTPPTNVYRDGTLYHPGKSGGSKGFGLGSISSAASSPAPASQRRFVSGEKFWVTKIEVRKDSVVFELYSDPYNDKRYHALLKFPFPPGTTPDLPHLLSKVSDVVTVDPRDSASEVAEAAPAPASAPQVAAIAPPPPPADAAPKTIALGQTKDQVVAALGQPVKIVKLAKREIYYYLDMKIIFTNGKVTDVQ